MTLQISLKTLHCQPLCVKMTLSITDCGGNSVLYKCKRRSKIPSVLGKAKNKSEFKQVCEHCRLQGG